MKLKRPITIGCKGSDVYGCERGLAKWAKPKKMTPDKVYEKVDSDLCEQFQREHLIKPASGKIGQKTLNALWPFMDAYARARYRLFRVPEVEKPGWMKIGPIVLGDQSVLEYDPTHKTTGIPLFIAFDADFLDKPLICPEDMKVDTKDSGAHPGEAFYATGKSKIRWWIGHLDRDHEVGTVLRQGQLLGTPIDTSIGGGTHVHVALNCEALLGKGKQLKYGKTGNGPDYTHGSPTIREQLEGAEL